MLLVGGNRNLGDGVIPTNGSGGGRRQLTPPAAAPYPVVAAHGLREGVMGAKWFGASVVRKEDPALLTGKGRYVDDIDLPGMLHAAFVRSPLAHARIRGIDKTAAKAMPGVHLVLAWADLPESVRMTPLPLFVPNAAITQLHLPVTMARDEVCYVGEPVAVVVAESRYLAEDAAALVAVDYESLPSVGDCRAALAPDSPPGSASSSAPAASMAFAPAPVPSRSIPSRSILRACTGGSSWARSVTIQPAAQSWRMKALRSSGASWSRGT